MSNTFTSLLGKQVSKIGKTFGIDLEVEGHLPHIELENSTSEEVVGNLSYATAFSSGFDLVSIETLTILPNSRALIDTGIKLKVHPSPLLRLYFREKSLTLLPELQIRARSGLAIKHGLMVLNAPGTVDADYDGPIKVCLFNTSQESFTIQKGDRIAQAVVNVVLRAENIHTKSETRGTGGFGSTGT